MYHIRTINWENKDEYYIILSIKEFSLIGQTQYVTDDQKCYATSPEWEK